MEPELFDLPDSFQNHSPRIGLVLGSGLGSFKDHVDVSVSLPYSDIPALPVSKVPGHSGEFHIGSIGGQEIIIAQGRVHLYEGHSAYDVAAHVRFMAQMGVELIILTNAAGIVNESFTPGHWMMITDHLNLTRQSPLTGGAHFIDQSAVYEPEL
ncbi:MAG: purine-nucleoside phosphorylase, partial [Verrucomicrobiota bacterium]